MKKEIQTQSAYDFYNLAAEMARATSFENNDKSIATIALKLVDNYLGTLYFNPYWPKLVEKRGPISSFYLFKCQECNRIAPSAGSAEFVDIGYMFCMKCGDLFEYSLWDKDLSEAANQRQFSTFRSTYGVIHFRECHCGGDLLTTASLRDPCVYCGAASTVIEITSLRDIEKYKLTDYPEYIALSSYQYLQSHKIFKLADFVDRAKGKILDRNEWQTRQLYEADVNSLALFGHLNNEISVLTAILRKHNKMLLAKRMEEYEITVAENQKSGIELLLNSYAGPDGLGTFSFSEGDVSSDYKGSVHDLNKEFKKLRTSIYQTAKKISAELRKLEQLHNE